MTVKRCRRQDGRLHKRRTLHMRQAAGANLKLRKSTAWQFRERTAVGQLSNEELWRRAESR